MNNKSEVPQLFIQFYNMVRTQFEKGIKRIHSDNGKEYVYHNFSIFTSKQPSLQVNKASSMNSHASTPQNKMAW